MSPSPWLPMIMLAWAGTAAPAAVGPCQDAATLEQVLERYVAARGGHDAVDRQQALRILSTFHEGRWNPEFDYRVMKPGYMWIRARYDDGQIIIEGFDGRRGWEQWGDKPAEYVGGDAERGVNQGAVSPVHLYGLHQMAELGASVSLEGCDSIEGDEFYVINVLSTFGTDIDYFISRGTHHLERSRTWRPLHPSRDPKPIHVEERWSDFRMVDGVLHPFAYSLWNVADGARLAWLEVLRIEPFPDATPAFFRKPD